MRRRYYKIGDVIVYVEDQSKDPSGSRATELSIQREKVRCFTAYGGKCVCCDEKNFAFLSLDHIKDDGWKSNGSGNRGGYTLYYRLRVCGYPKNIVQVLCHNCNAAKNIFGFCPHGGLQGRSPNETWTALSQAVEEKSKTPPADG